jgi:predicted alpha/beta superfamily hydrolase
VIAISPAVIWDGRWLFERERAFRKRHPELQRRLWLGVGENEWPEFTASCRDFFAQMEASAYTGLALRTCVIPGERHAGVKAEAYNRGLRHVFEHWSREQPSNGQL